MTDEYITFAKDAMAPVILVPVSKYCTAIMGTNGEKLSGIFSLYVTIFNL
jgi:hypothetical protein